MGTWLVTGCSSGIGRGIACAALAAGENVIVTARNPERVADIVSRHPDTSIALALDVSDARGAQDAIRLGCNRFGQIDVLVNNAGYGYRAAVEESEEEQVRAMFETNVFGPARLMRLVLPQMRARRSGTIVNVSSIGAVRAAVGNGFYSASKAALELLSEAVRGETLNLGIHTMIVEPGAFRTGFYGSLRETSARISDYDSSMGHMRLEGMSGAADQPGDPEAAGRLIVEMVLSGNPPQRLPLGSDAFQIIENALKNRLDEVLSLRELSSRTDFCQ